MNFDTLPNKVGMKAEDIGLWELNEAFASPAMMPSKTPLFFYPLIALENRLSAFDAGFI